MIVVLACGNKCACCVCVRACVRACRVVSCSDPHTLCAFGSVRFGSFGPVRRSSGRLQTRAVRFFTFKNTYKMQSISLCACFCQVVSSVHFTCRWAGAGGGRALFLETTLHADGREQGAAGGPTPTDRGWRVVRNNAETSENGNQVIVPAVPKLTISKQQLPTLYSWLEIARPPVRYSHTLTRKVLRSLHLHVYVRRCEHSLSKHR
jgi:hypothetical protein